MRFSVPRSNNTDPLIPSMSDLIIVWSMPDLIHYLIHLYSLCKFVLSSIHYLILDAVFRTPKPNTDTLIQTFFCLIVIWSMRYFIYALSDPCVIRSICYLIHSLSDPFVIWSNCYPIYLLSDPFAVWSICGLIHSLSDPFAVWSIRCLILSLSDPFTVRSIRCLIHSLSDPFAVWSIRCPIHTCLIHILSDPYGWGIQVLSRKTIGKNLRSKFL